MIIISKNGSVRGSVLPFVTGTIDLNHVPTQISRYNGIQPTTPSNHPVHVLAKKEDGGNLLVQSKFIDGHLGSYVDEKYCADYTCWWVPASAVKFKVNEEINIYNGRKL